MEINVEIVKGTIPLAERLAPRLREADVEEASWVACTSPLSSLKGCVKRSAYCMAGIVNGKVMAMWGVVPARSVHGEGYVWMFGAKGVEQYSLSMLREARRSMDAMHQLMPKLYTFIDVQRPEAVRFARAAGLIIGEEHYLSSPTGRALFIAESQTQGA